MLIPLHICSQLKKDKYTYTLSPAYAHITWLHPWYNLQRSFGSKELACYVYFCLWLEILRKSHFPYVSVYHVQEYFFLMKYQPYLCQFVGLIMKTLNLCLTWILLFLFQIWSRSESKSVFFFFPQWSIAVS